MHAFIMTAVNALKKLKEGNAKYLNAETSRGNISRMLRKYTHENGQHPYAIMTTSRQITAQTTRYLFLFFMQSIPFMHFRFVPDAERQTRRSVFPLFPYSSFEDTT